MSPHKLHLIAQCVVALVTACAIAGCRGPLPPLAVSPLGHGGPPNKRGPTPVSPLWRANALSAPAPHGPCMAPAVPSGIRCLVTQPPGDPYAAALAESAYETFAPQPLDGAERGD